VGEAVEKSRQKSFQIVYSELSIREELGRGAFGLVSKAVWRNQDVAVKQMLNLSKDQLKDFFKEADLMCSLRPHGKNIVVCKLKFQIT
jgi:hypothetical protein